MRNFFKIIAIVFMFLYPSVCFSDPNISIPSEHYSPKENLENIDLYLIGSAKHTIDLTMFTFTDKKIASALIDASKRGVTVRIYRDNIQMKGSTDTTPMFKGTAVQIKAKDNGPRNIMHLKIYLIDNNVLREGSANFTPQAEGAFCTKSGNCGHNNQQDNNIYISDDPIDIDLFESTFTRIWNRTSNKNIQ